MSARIRQVGDPILREVSAPIALAEISSPRVQDLIQHMQSVLDGIKAISDENGNALSAPQVGSLLRLIVLRIDGEFCPMINPEFVPASEQKFEFEEECFSLYNKRATVSRYYAIELNYLDKDGHAKTTTLSGEESGLVQHEIDHLNGVLFVDHVRDDNLLEIDEVFAHDPPHLAKLKTMMAFMAADSMENQL